MAITAASAEAGREGLDFSPQTILRDYRLAYRSRQVSLLGRREVLTGKAKFGIFGDGKEVAQVAMARAFRPGDVRSGYYRDQTLMLALGQLTLEQFFAQLYADPSVEAAVIAMRGSYPIRPISPWTDRRVRP